MLKNGIKAIDKKEFHYIVRDGNKKLKSHPWLGDSFSFLYDFIMKSSVFLKKMVLCSISGQSCSNSNIEKKFV